MSSHRKKQYGCDSTLAWTLAALIMAGIIMVFSSSAVHAQETYQDSFYLLKRHVTWVLLGTGLLIFARKFDYHRWEKLTLPIMAATFLLLLAVMVPALSKEVGGARRWLTLGGLSLQPSEIAKFTVVLFIAKSMVKRADKLKSFAYGYLPNLIVLGIFFLLILLQPDFGTAMIISIVAFLMLYVAGIQKKFLAYSVLAVIPFLVTAVMGAQYRTRRILSFLDPWADPSGTGFQAIQSFLAFGRGGIWGLGLGDSRQKLFYLPEAHTDFIFSVIGEELGIIGTLGIILLFGILIWRGFVIASQAKDLYGTHLAIGVTLLVGVQAFTNMGVAVGVLPTKGLTLPFISLGGSSLLITLLCMGVLLNISDHSVRR